MISDGMKNVAGLLPGNSELTEPGFSLHGSFLSAAANYLLCHVTEVRTPHPLIASSFRIFHSLSRNRYTSRRCF